jgi:predicted DNA-binding transcriptional regulator AlpA
MLELFGKIISIVQHSLESQETSITQIDPINWQLALLTQNPFPDTPPSRPEDTVWAGFPDLKKQLDTLFTEAFSSSRRISSLTLIDSLTLYRSTNQRFALVLTPPPQSINYLALSETILVPCFSKFYAAYTQVRPPQISQFCPKCLGENPYFSLGWVPVALCACLRHQCLLIDRCPNCHKTVSQYEVITAQCDKCEGSLTQAKVISIANDEIGLRTQRILQSWFMDYLTPEQEASHLPPHAPVLLYRIIEGLHNSLETHKSGEWFYLHHPPSHREKLILTHRKQGEFLTSYESYCTYSTVCKAILNWPESFLEFLRSYCSNSRDELQNKLLIGSPAQNLGILYTRWLKKHWSYAEFKFLQEIFDSHLMNDCWLNSAHIRTNFYKKRPDAVEQSKYVSIEAVADFLNTSLSVIKLLQRNKLLTQVSADQQELADKQEVLSFRKAWDSPTTLRQASMLLGLTERVTKELVILGLLVQEYPLKYSISLQYKISEVIALLEKISRHVQYYSSPEFVKEGSWDKWAEADHIFCKEGFNAVTLLLQVMTGNLKAFHSSNDKFQLNTLFFASQDIRNCVERLGDQSLWLESKEVSRLLGIKDSTLKRWIRNGHILPIVMCRQRQYFDAEKVHAVCSKYVTQKEAACLLTVSISTLQSWILAHQMLEMLIDDPNEEGEDAHIFDREQLIKWRNEHCTSNEAVQILEITKTTLYRWVKEGKLRPLDTLNGNQHWFVKQAILSLRS